MLQLQSQSHVYIQGGSLSVSLARSEFEIEEAQRLRYQVFAEEMGANIVSNNGLDIDKYDEHCQHLLVRERENDRIIGCYRLLTAEGAAAVGGWYSANEFDLSRLQHILPHAVELGRACVHQDYRSGSTITLLWAGLMQFMQQQGLEYMIGCGSMCMKDGGHIAASIFHRLQEQCYAPPEYRVFPNNPLPIAALRQDLEVEFPALIKGYVRAGAYICGEPHWDTEFNSADVLVMMPISRINPRYARHFLK